MRLIFATTVAVLALVSAASANADPTGAKLRHPVSGSHMRMATDNTGNAPGGTARSPRARQTSKVTLAFEGNMPNQSCSALRPDPRKGGQLFLRCAV
jgi:hypothetical protein